MALPTQASSLLLLAVFLTGSLPAAEPARDSTLKGAVELPATDEANRFFVTPVTPKGALRFFRVTVDYPKAVAVFERP